MYLSRSTANEFNQVCSSLYFSINKISLLFRKVQMLLQKNGNPVNDGKRLNVSQYKLKTVG